MLALICGKWLVEVRDAILARDAGLLGVVWVSLLELGCGMPKERRLRGRLLGVVVVEFALLPPVRFLLLRTVMVDGI